MLPGRRMRTRSAPERRRASSCSSGLAVLPMTSCTFSAVQLALSVLSASAGSATGLALEAQPASKATLNKAGTLGNHVDINLSSSNEPAAVGNKQFDSRLCRVTQAAKLAAHHIGIGRRAQAVQLAGDPSQPAILPLFTRRQQALCFGFGAGLVLAVEVGAAAALILFRHL